MSNGRFESRVKVCLKCKVYIRLFLDNAISQKREKEFDTRHPLHTIQIIIKDELDDKYFDKYKLEKKLEKL